MRQRSYFAPFSRLVLSLFIVFVCTTLLRAQDVPSLGSAALSELPPSTKMPGCISNAQSGYAGKSCIIYINRLAPVSPPPSVIPKNTTVYAVLYNTRWNEAVTFTSAISKTTTPDIAAATLKNAATPLQSVVTSIIRNPPPPGIVQPKDVQPGSDLSQRQSLLRNELNKVQAQINHSNASLTCLSNYEAISDGTVDPATNVAAQYSCSQKDLLSVSTFVPQKDRVVAEATGAGQATLPIVLLKRLDATVTALVKDCENPQKPLVSECASTLTAYVNNENALDSGFTAIQSSQGGLLQTVRVIEAWPGTPDNVAFKFKAAKFSNLTLTITGQEIVNKIPATIASVVINTQANPWVLSTGLSVSNLKYHTYIAAPVIGANGQPVLDSSGKATTVVTQQTQTPSFVAPLALFSYRLGFMSHATGRTSVPTDARSC